MATLAEIRARLQAQDNRQQNPQQSTNSDTTIFAHWNMPEGTNCKVRFLPDANTKNPDGFFLERAMIKLPFNGIRGGDSKPVIVQVPCVEMYDPRASCPILSQVRPWYKDESLKEMANKYWKKRTYLYQGFVHANAVPDDVTPENPIRRFIISPQIQALIKSALLDPELENLPTDYQFGIDFTITKTSKGGYADYSTSSFSRRESALTAAELAAIEQYGLFNLADFLPKRPGETELKVMAEMFEASVDGEAYDPDRWAQYYKPAGFQYSGSTNVPAVRVQPKNAQPAAASEESDATETVVQSAASEEVKPAAKPNPQDILNMIRNRQKA